MPKHQAVFELVPETLAKPQVASRMTSKQAKKAYQKAQRGPKITKEEQRRRDAEELKRHREEYKQYQKEREKEKAQEKAKAAREKKAAKAAAEKAERKQKGIPEPVRSGQSRISLFIQKSKKRLLETDSLGEESESTICEDKDATESPAKQSPKRTCEDRNAAESPSKNPAKRIKLDDSDDDEYGDFPALSDNEITLLENKSRHSTPFDFASRRGSTAFSRSVSRDPASVMCEPELPRLIRNQGESEDHSPEKIQELADSQIRSEAADAAMRSSPEPEEERTSDGNTSAKTSGVMNGAVWKPNRIGDYRGSSFIGFTAGPKQNSNIDTPILQPPKSLVKPMLERSPVSKSTKATIHQSAATENGRPKFRPYPTETPVTSRQPFQERGLNGNTANPRSTSRDVVNSPKTPFVPVKKPILRLSNSNSGLTPRKPFSARSPNSGTHPIPPQKKPTTPANLISKVKRSTYLTANLPPSSTQAFLESHLDDFFPSPSQEARELSEELIPTPRAPAPAPFKTTSKSPLIPKTKVESPPCPSRRSNVPEIINLDDDFSMICTQDLMMSSQELRELTPRPHISLPKEEQGDSKNHALNEAIGGVLDDLENLICSQDWIPSSQESVSAPAPATISNPKPPPKEFTPAAKSSNTNLPPRASTLAVGSSIPRPQMSSKIPSQNMVRTTPHNHLNNREASPVASLRNVRPSQRAQSSQRNRLPLKDTSPKLSAATSLTRTLNPPRAAIKRSPFFKEKPEDKPVSTKPRFFEEKEEDLLEAAIAESKLYADFAFTPTPRKPAVAEGGIGNKKQTRVGGLGDMEEDKENRGPGVRSDNGRSEDHRRGEERKRHLERQFSDSSTDYGIDDDDDDWALQLEALWPIT